MSRLLIFNLPRGASTDEVRQLLDHVSGPVHAAAARERALAVRLHPVPGADDESFAVVQLAPDSTLARTLARHLNGRRLVGWRAAPRPLWVWLPVMAWA